MNLGLTKLSLTTGLFFLVLSSSVFAAAGDHYWITEPSVVNVKHKDCDDSNSCTFDLVAEITVTLNGCADSVVYHSFSVERNDGKTAVKGSILAKTSPFSGTVYCFAPATQTFTVNLGIGAISKEDVTVQLTPGKYTPKN